MTAFIYKQDDIALKILSEIELEGRYSDWFSDSEVHLYNSHWARPKTSADVQLYIDSIKNDKTKLIFAVYALKHTVHIGNISLQNIDHYNQSAEMAFMFGERAYWGKGYAFIASQFVMRHAYQHLNLNRLYLGCLDNNAAMEKLALKLGFKPEGIRRHALFNNGEFRDVLEFGQLKDEFI